MHGVRLTAASQPAEKDIVVADAVRVDEQEHLLRLLVAARGCLGLRIVEVEHIVIEVVALWGEEGETVSTSTSTSTSTSFTSCEYLDGAEVDQHVLKLPEEEEAGGHGLPARDCVCHGEQRQCSTAHHSCISRAHTTLTTLAA